MCNNYYPIEKKGRFEIGESMISRLSSNKTNSWQILCYSPANNESTILELSRASQLSRKSQPS